MDDDIGEAIKDPICNKVFQFVNRYTNQSFQSKAELFNALYNHPNFSTKLDSSNLKVRARAQFILLSMQIIVSLSVPHFDYYL